MKFVIACAIVLGSLITPLMAASYPTKVSMIESQFNSFYRIERSSGGASERGRIADIVGSYNNLFSPSQGQNVIRSLPSQDIKLLFRAAYIAQFYSNDIRYVSDMQLDIHELEERGKVSRDEYVQMYWALVSNREFDLARNLVKGNDLNEVGVLPEFRDMTRDGVGRRTGIEVGASGALIRLPIDISHGQHIVVVSHPLCHFTRYAIEYISSHKLLNDVFAKNSIWIVPPEGNLNLKAMALWNEEYPDEKMKLMYRTSEWPEFDTFETPTFYFFKDGRLIGRLVGWPKTGATEALRHNLMKIGLPSQW